MTTTVLGVPYDRHGNLLRVGTPTSDWRPNDPFVATLTYWDAPHPLQAYAKKPKGYYTLKDMATGATYPISYSYIHANSGLWRVPTNQPSWRMLWLCGVPCGPVSGTCISAPQPRTDDPVPDRFPLDPSWWGFAWAGWWVVTRQGRAFSVRYLGRDLRP